jgi:cell migration-inducing and hyaluronan-binding protein
VVGMLGIPTAAGAAGRVTSKPGKFNWSDPAAWQGGVPAAGDDVVVSAGSKLVLDLSPPALGGLQIDGSLVFSELDLELRSDWIAVHGTFKVGSAKKPFSHRAVVTLTGPESNEDVMDMGTKVLGVMGGTLDLHGSKRKSWTRLTKTAQPGATSIIVENASGWRAGDRIVVASSDYWGDHYDERTVNAVSGNSLTLDRALEYRHWGELQTYAGQTVDERAEVGLLTRNVVVQGDESSTDTKFGGQVVVMEGGAARIEGVEFDRMGQRKRLRRYPVHFHMDGPAGGSYLKRSAISHSFNRCVVVHGTHGLKVKDNVCFDHVGHGYFLEDGIETDNVFTGNLGLGTRGIENGLLPSDDRPATFWITNPDNIFRNNVAAGSDGVGFWYALPQHPTGLSQTGNVWPRRTPLGAFSGNVAHSNGNNGLNVDDGPRPNGETESAYYSPVADPSDGDSDPVVARFEDFTSYFNRDRGVWLRGTNHVVSNAVLADNRSGATFASSDSFLDDSLVVGETANPGMTEDWEDPGYQGRALPAFWEPDAQVIGFEFYDGRVGVRRTTFAGFKTNPVRPSGALGYLAPDAFSIDPSNFAEDVKFVDSDRVYLAPVEADYDGDASKVFVDRDGSLTGTPGMAVVVDNPFLVTDACAQRAAWGAWLCSSDYASLIVGADPTSIKPVMLTRADGVAQKLMGCCDDSDDAVTSLLPNERYSVVFNGGTPDHARFVLYRGKGKWLELAIPVTGDVKVTRWDSPLPGVDSLAALRTAADSSYYREGSTLYLRLLGRGDYEELEIKR